MSDPILLKIEGRLARIILNRPEKLNAINRQMLGLLDEALSRLDADEQVRVVLLSGEGGRAFSSGADIGEWSTLEPHRMWLEWDRPGQRLFDKLAGLRQPVIAIIDGYALGGGLELALAADIRLASTRSEFALPEVRVGTVPGWGGTQRLVHLIGPGRAKQMIYSGCRVDAMTAERWGLANEITEPEDLSVRALKLAEEIASGAPLSVQMAKCLLDTQGGLERRIALEGIAAAAAAATEDGREGSKAFRERRPAEFKGR